MHRPASILAMLSLTGLLLAPPAFAQIPPPPDGAAGLGQHYTGHSYSPYAERDFADEVFWGDTHLHTSYSMDAGAFGNRLGLDEAYRFARGEQVTASGGQPTTFPWTLQPGAPSTETIAMT